MSETVLSEQASVLAEKYALASGCIEVASKVTRDRYGQKTIAPGNLMIVDRATGECERASDDNIERFINNGMSFYINPDENMRSSLLAMQNSKEEFGTAIGMNVEALKGVAIPGCNLPWWVRLVPAPISVRFGRCAEFKVRQADFFKYLEQQGVIPSKNDIRDDVYRDIENANLFRIYELRGWGAAFHVYSIFITHVGIVEQSGVRRLSIKPVDARIYKKVIDFVKLFKGRLDKPNYRCITIGSFGSWDNDLNTLELPDAIQVLSAPNMDGSHTWSTRHSPLEHTSHVYRKLVYRLYPESWTKWHDKISGILKDESFECSMTVGKMASISRVPSDCVAEIFDDLRKSGKKWRSARNKATGELSILPSHGEKDEGSFAPARRKWPLLLGVFLFSATLIQMFIFRIINNGLQSENVFGMSAGFFLLFVFLIFKNNFQRKIEE